MIEGVSEDLTQSRTRMLPHYGLGCHKEISMQQRVIIDTEVTHIV